MNKEKQVNLNIEMEAIEQKLVEGIDGNITKIEETNNHTFFDSESFEKREGYGIYVILDNGEEISEFYSKLDSPRGFKQSNMYLFKQKYGKYPEEGMKIKAVLNEEGFFRILK